MMTSKDFDILARNLGWEFHMGDARVMTDGIVWRFNHHSNSEPMSKEYGRTSMLTRIVDSCRQSNSHFNEDKFLKAINAYKEIADKIGNAMFDAPMKTRR